MYQLESNLYFTEAFLYETTESRKKWNDLFPLWEKKFSSGNEQSPYYDYCIAVLYLQKGLIALKYSEFIQAGVDVRKSLMLLEKNYKRFPDFYIQYKELGLLQCFLGNIPEQYEWLTGIAGVRGDLKGGEKKLKQLLELSFNRKEFEFLQAEVLMYYVAVVTVLYNEPERSGELHRYIHRLKDNYRSSPLGIFIISNVYAHAGENEKSLEFIKKYNRDRSEIKFDYLDYFHGLLLLQRVDSDSKKYFEQYIREFNGMHYIRSAYNKIAWCWLIEGNDEQYNLYISLAKNSGKTLVDADKQALSEAKLSKTPQKNLLKARLLSDGGYYVSALQEMNAIDTTIICQTPIYCIEYYYRLARISHLRGDVLSAVNLYDRVIEMGETGSEYYAANSALQTGLIYENLNDFKNAEKYFRLCLAMPFEEYRNSIQQKAKAGLQRLGRR